MIETDEVEGALGVKVKLPNANLILIYGKKGYLMCGYLNIEAAEKLGDAAAVVTGVSTFKDMLKARLAKVTSHAKRIGLLEGMTGREAIKLLK